jgi:hypothetical protein
MSKLAAAHKTVYTLVKDAIGPYALMNDIEINVTVGDRIQGTKGPEVTINQSTFDVTNLSTSDYSVFEFGVNSYSKSYIQAAEMADSIYSAMPASEEQYNLFSTNWYIEPLDLFLEYSDRDDYQASVLIRLRDAGV